MVRRLKPESELTAKGKRRRKENQKNPDKHKARKKRMNEYYLETKEKQQFSKKLKTKEQREFVIKKMGGKCMSCGEQYNPHSRPSNLEFDHKTYLESKTTHAETFRQVLAWIKRGDDPKKQFALLCHTCHMIVTYLRRDPKKTRDTLEYARNEKILD